MKQVLLLAVVAALCGCAAVDYSPVVGEVGVGPTSKAAVVKSFRGVPVYLMGFPPKKYVPIGVLSVSGNNYMDSQLLAVVGAQARKYKADGAILLDKGERYAGTVSSANAFTSGSMYGNSYGSAYRSGSSVYGSGSYYGNAFANTSATGFSAPVYTRSIQVVLFRWVQ